MKAILSFGMPASISIILLLAVNVFLVKKTADGDYIDNGLKYEIIVNNEASYERFLQYQEQGYLDDETIVYEGEEVIKLREGLISEIKRLSPMIDGTKIDTSTLGEKVIDEDLIQKLEKKLAGKRSLKNTLENVDRAIERHNRSRDTGRLLMSAILILFPIYILPVSISFFRSHSYRWPITIITVFAGWTVIGFVLMLTWSVWPKGKFS